MFIPNNSVIQSVEIESPGRYPSFLS